MFGVTESYFTLHGLPVVLGANRGQAVLLAAACLVSLGHKVSLHVHVLEEEGGPVFQTDKQPWP